MMTHHWQNPWFWFGIFGQSLFALRFIVQWIISEKHKQSIIPIQFWYFSLGGGLLTFIYALHVGDPVFIIGQSSGLIVYFRNLYLIHQAKHKHAAA